MKAADGRTRSGSSPAKVGAGVGLLVLLVALVGAAGVWQFNESRALAREQILNDHLVRARLNAAIISADLSARLQMVEAFATRPSFLAAVSDHDQNSITTQLKDLIALEDSFSSVEVIGSDGRVSAVYPAGAAVVGVDRSFRDYFRRASMSDEPYLSDAYLVDAIESRVAVAFASRLELSSGRQIGVLKAASEIDRSLLPSLREPSTVEVQVFDGKGTPVLGGGGGLSSGLSHFGVGKALQGGSGAGEFPAPDGAGRTVGAYAPVPDVGWAIVRREPGGRAFAMVKPLLWRFVSVGTLLLLAAGAVAFLLLRLLRRLGAERNRSQALLASMADGVIVTDAEQRILLMNPAMERIIGWSLGEARGEPAGDVTGFSAGSPEATERELQMISAALQRGETASSSGAEHVMRSRDGRLIPVAWTAAPVIEDREVTGIVAVIRDVSREREIDQLKSSLVSTVSHELRTPLTMIQGFAELLLTREMPPDRRREAVTQIHSAAERLSSLIDDLLSVSRIDSGRLKVDLEEVDVRSVLTEALAGFGPDERSRIRLEVDDGLPPVLADQQRFAQIVINLYSNALKYSTAPELVEVSARAEPANVEVAVTDHGLGLSAEEASHVFEKFFRADNRDIREVPGTGLGLYIAQSLAAMQGGRIRVESEPGRGSTFFLSLPCVRPEVELAERDEVKTA